jgi:putative copper resistance protein D
LSVVAAAALVYASWRRPGLPGGYLGVAATSVSRLHLRPGISLAALLVVGVGLGLLLGSHAHRVLSPEEASEGNPVPSSPESIEQGRLLFMQNCSQCHGETGRGDGPLASTLPLPPANLYDHVPFHPDQFFYSVITNGLSGAMPAFDSQLSSEERWDILNFLRARFGEPAAAQ